MTQDVLEKPAQKPSVEINASRLFPSWLAGTGASLALSTYQAGKIFLIGTKPGGGLSIFERSFERSMGLGVGADTLWAGTLYQLWKFDNFLDPGDTASGYDAMYVPTVGHTTGDIDIHDIHIDPDGRPVFVATRFNCIATLAERGSFRPLWRPPFIDRIAAEDRCHLNGLAFENGAPSFATAVSTSNVSDGWRAGRKDGGVLIYTPSDDIVATGLSMPHSPRVYQEKIYLLQAGTGEFGTIEESSGTFEPICFLPGFARGLSFVDDYAVIGLSRPRDNRSFSGLALDDRLAREGVPAQTAVVVVNLKTGDVEHRLSFEGVISELYDVQILPKTRRPMLHGFKSDAVRFQIRTEIGQDDGEKVVH